MNKFLINTLIVFFVLLGLINFTSCEEDDTEILDPVEATYEVDSTNTNYPIFNCTSINTEESITYYWDFGNGVTSYESYDTAYFPFPGEYNIILQVTSAGGYSIHDSLNYVCDSIDPSLENNPYLTNLTYDESSGEYTKSWVLSNQHGHISTGVSASIENGRSADYLNDPIVETFFYPLDYLLEVDTTQNAYDNIMEFNLYQYVYRNTGPSKWIVNWYFANSEFGYSQAAGIDVSIDVSQGLDTAGNYLLEENGDGTVFLTLSDKNFLLYYEGKPSKTKYQVLALYEDLMVVRKLYFDINGDPAGYRMLRYVPESNKDLPLPVYDISVIYPPTE